VEETAIDPLRLYAFAEAAQRIPSCRAGKKLATRTLHQWRKAGRLKAVARPSGGTTYWFVYGAEILRLLGGGPDFHGPTPSQQRRQYEADMRWFRQRGFKV